MYFACDVGIISSYFKKCLLLEDC